MCQFIKGKPKITYCLNLNVKFWKKVKLIFSDKSNSFENCSLMILKMRKPLTNIFKT